MTLCSLLVLLNKSDFLFDIRQAHFEREKEFIKMNDSTTTTASFFESMSYAMRSMFYLLTPSETFYEHKYQVPDLPLKSMEVFFGFIFVENIIHLAQEGKLAGSVSDGITSVTAGMLSLIPGYLFFIYIFLSSFNFPMSRILIRGISIMAYEWIYENLRVYDIAWNSIWTYLITLLLVDMSYYWLHRASHGMLDLQTISCLINDIFIKR